MCVCTLINNPDSQDEQLKQAKNEQNMEYQASYTIQQIM